MKPKSIKDAIKSLGQDFQLTYKVLRKDWRWSIAMVIGFVVAPLFSISLGASRIGPDLSGSLVDLAILALVLGEGLLWVVPTKTERRIRNLLVLFSLAAGCCFTITAAIAPLLPLTGSDFPTLVVNSITIGTFLAGPFLLCLVAVATLVYLLFYFLCLVLDNRRKKGGRNNGT